MNAVVTTTPPAVTPPAVTPPAVTPPPAAPTPPVAVKPPVSFAFNEKDFEQNFGKVGTDGRPENVPEKLWDKDKKAIKADVLLAQMKWAEGKLGKNLDLVGSPAEPYKVELGDELKVAVFGESDPAEDPMVKAFLGLAKESDWSQGFVTRQLTWYAQTMQRMATEQVTAEIAKLGDNGQQRLTDVKQWIDAQLGPEKGAALAAAMTSAEVVEAVEQLMRGTLPPRVAPNATTPAGGQGPSKDEWEALYFAVDEKGQRKVAIDPEYRKRCDVMRDQVFGTARRDSNGRAVDAAGRPI